MKKISLTKGKFALVDDEDYDFLMQWKWYCGSHGYAERSVYLGKINGSHKSRRILMHRQLMNTQDAMQVDHIDGDKLNNSKNNLRNVTDGENKLNKPAQKNGKSKYKGVHWHGQRKKWTAQIKRGKKRLSLGLFLREEEAAMAYDIAARELHGEYAYQNIQVG